MTCAAYNEIDPFAAAWLRNLIAADLIAPGVVDERSITDLEPADVAGLRQFHAFAGIGGWSYALRLSGWPDDRPVWTGSCPCQPFSAAGKGGGFDDPRHLWPAWFRLIRECRPPVVFGEQVASKGGLAWFDHVSTDLEAEGYAVGAADLCAAGVGAPHIRQRLFFVAHAVRGGPSAQGHSASDSRWPPDGSLGSSAASVLEHSESRGLRIDRVAPGDAGHAHESEQARGVADSERERVQPIGRGGSGETAGGVSGGEEQRERLRVDASTGTCSPWSDLVWLPCRDGKARPTQPSIFPLAHGVPNRVGTLRGAGNAIVAPLAAEFVMAYMAATS